MSAPRRRGRADVNLYLPVAVAFILCSPQWR